MYFLCLVLKTVNGFISVGMTLYVISVAIISHILSKKNKYFVVKILSVIPIVFAVVHFAIYRLILLDHFWPFYVMSFIPLIFLFEGKKLSWKVLRTVVASVLAFCLFVYFTVDSIGRPMVHNYSNLSYTKSFELMLDTLEEEYCLNSWKDIDYEYLHNRYYPRVEEAEHNSDKEEFLSVIYEVIHEFHDSHVNVRCRDNSLFKEYLKNHLGYDYGFSMIRLDDGNIVAVVVEPDSDVANAGIHDGTIILAWDSQEINEACDAVECIVPSYQFPVKENEDFIRPLYLACTGGEYVDITFLNDSGEEQTVTAHKDTYNWQYPYRFFFAYYGVNRSILDYDNFDHFMLDDQCGYLRISAESVDVIKDNIACLNEGYYPELTEMYASYIQDLKNQGMEYLIVDIRDNCGGYDCVAGALVSLFIDEKEHMVSFGYEDDDGYHICESQYIFPDGRYKDLPVVALVNSGCVSAGDGMAKFLGDCDNVTLMGFTVSSGVNQNDGGYVYMPADICIAYPVFLSLSEDGIPLIDTDASRENNIPIDVYVPITSENIDDLFSLEEEYKDVELEYAIQYLEN
ncbi:MAG: hypothetical protein KBS96_00375 [Lachnospiraceae bacterium]|nr:hypothetical protein [Candidatus Colinaster scatohippi]